LSQGWIGAFCRGAWYGGRAFKESVMGVPELLIILVIVLVLFGAGKLPAIGDALGRTIKNFKRASAGTDEIEVSKNERLGGGNRDALGDGGIEDADVIAGKRKAKKES
jgi:sec-independent protein translocase protein TatA